MLIILKFDLKPIIIQQFSLFTYCFKHIFVECCWKFY